MLEEPVEERLLKAKLDRKEKVKSLEENQTPSFQPFINPRTRIIAHNIKVREKAKLEREREEYSYIDQVYDFQFRPKEPKYFPRNGTLELSSGTSRSTKRSKNSEMTEVVVHTDIV